MIVRYIVRTWRQQCDRRRWRESGHTGEGRRSRRYVWEPRWRPVEAGRGHHDGDPTGESGTTAPPPSATPPTSPSVMGLVAIRSGGGSRYDLQQVGPV